MKRAAGIGWVWLLAAAATSGWGAGAAPAGDSAKAAFARLKSLAGEWQGRVGSKDGPPVKVVYRVTAEGSALMETLFPETPHEMVTVYHMSGDSLVLTHYCASGNQPHMRFDPSASTPDRLVFAFDGGTSFDPAVDTHMHSAVLALKDANHLEAEWTIYQKGQQGGAHQFLLERVPAATK